MIDPDTKANGAGAALLVDTLLSLGIDDPFALTHQEQSDAINAGAAEGRVDAQRLALLRSLGAIPK